MLDYIEKLRQKPDRTKTLIAFSAALLFSGTIFLVWMTVVLPDVKKDQVVKDKIASIEPSPLASFFSNIAEGFSGVKEQFVGIAGKVTELSANAISSSPEKIETTTTPITHKSEVQFVEVTSTSTKSTATTTKIIE